MAEKRFGLSATIVLFCFALVACDLMGGESNGSHGSGSNNPDDNNGGTELHELSGNITIGLSLFGDTVSQSLVGETLFARYTGSEHVSFQWQRNGNNTGSNSSQYTPELPGIFTVTVNATGYQSKTSDPVTVADDGLMNLNGSIVIVISGSTHGGSEIGIPLIANYNGTEIADFNFQWKRDGIEVGTNSDTYIPSQAGNYTVTVSATGYRSRTSAPVRVFGMVWNATVTGTALPWNRSIENIAFGNGKWIAVGQQWNFNQSGHMAYSIDGVNWAAIEDSSFSDIPALGVAFGADANGNGRWVAVGSRFTNSGGFNTYTHMIVYSDDNGVTWTEPANSSLADIFSWHSGINTIAFGGNRWVAAGTNGRMAFSSDGVTWTAVTDSTLGNIRSLAFGNNRWVAGGEGRMAFSNNGVSWTEVTDVELNDTSSAWIFVAHGGNQWVAVTAMNEIAYSDNGVNWTRVVSDEFSGNGNSLVSVAYGNGLWIAGGFGRRAYSTDGRTWTAVTDRVFGDFEQSGIYVTTYANGIWLAGGSDGQIAYAVRQ